ncbi:MAG: DUF4149 domain-containing protein [Nitrosomonadales bacterium]|nr:DUF4149 domain-containing protein [Nitrosomonadales bacterium]
MNSFLNKLSFIFTSLWVGGLWAMLMVTYVIFNMIPSSYIAGVIVSNLFFYLNFFGMITLTLILGFGFHSEKIKFFKKMQAWLALLLLLILSISFFGINPLLEALKVEAFPKEVMESVFADRFSAWHGIASIAYLIQCFLGIFLLLKSR